MLYYAPIDYSDLSTYQTLAARLLPSEKKHGTIGNRIFYLAIPPTIYETVILNLGESGLSREEGCYSHIVIEKPIGRDLASVRRLNTVLTPTSRKSRSTAWTIILPRRRSRIS